MALTATTLASAMTAGQKVIKLTSATGAAKKMLAMVDLEIMRITSVDLTPTLEVVPGYQGTTAGAHGILAPVIYGNPIDFVNVSGPQSTSYGIDGAITVPVVDTFIYLTKATAGAYTLAAPNIGQTNTVCMVSTTAAAHTVTMAGNASATDVGTFGGAVGNSFTVKAENGIWACIAQNGVTVA